MSLNEIDYAIYSILSTDTTIASYLSDVTKQIKYGDDQTFTKLPRIVYEKISDPNLWRKPERWQRWRFYITHPDLVKCENIQDRVVTLFTNGVGTAGTVDIMNANVIDRGRTPLWYENISAYKTYIDVRITYL